MKISKTDCLRTPKADGFYMPGEFEPHEGTLMIWPWRPGSWNYGAKAARAAFAEIAEAIAAYEQVYLFVRPQDKASAQELLSSDRIPNVLTALILSGDMGMLEYGFDHYKLENPVVCRGEIEALGEALLYGDETKRTGN